MAQVYGGSALNIAAVAAEDAGVGCFFNRKPTWRCQVRLRSNEGRTSRLHDVFPNRWAVPEKNALRKRGWVVQERFLSRRTLHFTERQVFWECGANPACEYLPRGYESRPIQNEGHFELERPRRPAFNMRRQPLSWPGVVEAFSWCSLTRTRDRLVAIGGLAKVIHERSNADYIAGMWRENLEVQLCWKAGWHRATERIVPPTAPTWSWASVIGHVNFEHAFPERYVTGFIHEDKINAAASAKPRMHARIWNTQQLPFNHFGEIDHTNFRLRLRCDFLFFGIIRVGSWSLSPEGEKNCCFDRHAVKLYGCSLDSRLPDGQNYVHAFFLPIFTSYEVFPLVVCQGCHGILLSPTEKKIGEYQRIGSFIHHYYQPEGIFGEANGENLVLRGSKYHFSEVLKGEDDKDLFFIDVV